MSIFFVCVCAAVIVGALSAYCAGEKYKRVKLDTATRCTLVFGFVALIGIFSFSREPIPIYAEAILCAIGFFVSYGVTRSFRAA